MPSLLRKLIFSRLHLRKSWHGTANRGGETDVFGSARHVAKNLHVCRACTVYTVRICRAENVIVYVNGVWFQLRRLRQPTVFDDVVRF